MLHPNDCCILSPDIGLQRRMLVAVVQVEKDFQPQQEGEGLLCTHSYTKASHKHPQHLPLKVLEHVGLRIDEQACRPQVTAARSIAKAPCG